MTEKELIGNLLNVPDSEQFSNESRVSTLLIALRGARKLCGRSLDTGDLIDEDKKLDKLIEELEEGRYYSALFIGLTNYLVLLDLLGFVFTKQKNIKNIPKDGIMNALNSFTDLTPNEKKAIKALRNSLAHNFGLANKDYNFSLSYQYENMMEIARPPTVKKGESRQKILININEVELCTFIESIYTKVVNHHKKDEIYLTMTELQVKNRFTII